ncbi:hypothetical protein M0805_009680 [Coniferiporia weirii]|nr:hypothetical protein M0805_009680 [Coniferiporia weirii]
MVEEGEDNWFIVRSDVERGEGRHRRCRVVELLSTAKLSDISSASSASTKTFTTALWLNAAVFGIELLAFTILRPRFRAIYEPRSYIPSEDKRSPPLASRILAWPLAVWRTDYHDILHQNGMDAYFFVRFLRMIVKILLPIWIVSWVILLPITSVGTSSGKSGLDEFTFGNVGTGQQPRYAAHLVVTWLFTFWIWYVIRSEMKNFVTMRQQYLVDPTYAASAQAHTVLVTGVPSRMLSERSIEKLFSNLPGGVKKVWLNRDLKELPNLYNRRLAACNKLESAETSILKAAANAHAKRLKAEAKAGGAKEAKNTDPERGPVTADGEADLATLVPEADRPSHRLPAGPMPFSLPLIGKKVDSIAWAREEIANTTAELDKGRAVLHDEASSPDVVVRSQKTGGVLGLVSRKTGGGKSDAKNEEGKSSDNSSVRSGATQVETYPPLNSAFVLFHNQAAAHMAGQLLTHHEPYRMSGRHVGVAPDDVIWGNLGLNPYEMKVRVLISYAATAGLIICWAIPVAFVGLVSNVAGLCKTYSWLAWLCGIPPTVLGIIQGILPPVLLAVLMMLLPIILRMLAKFEGIPRRTDVELSLMTRFFIFQVVHSFLVVTLASGIIAALPELVSNPTSIPSILAKNLPQASTFFLTYIVLQGLSGTASGFLQIVPLIIYYVKLFILGSTPRSVYSIKYTLRGVSWGTLFPTTTLLVVITIAYSVISPIINGLACFTFILFYYLWKYLFLYQLEQPTANETGGLFFPKAIQHVFVGLYIQQICLAALYFLARDANNKASAIPEGAIMIVLIVFTACFHLMINNSYGPLLNYLPLSLSEKAHTNSADAGAVTRQSTRNSAKHKMSGSGEYGVGSGSGDVDGNPEHSEKAALVERGKDEETEPQDFTHPAVGAPQRIVWIPTDALGFARSEMADCREAGVDASTSRAAMDVSGHVDISGAPPGEDSL